MVVIALKEKRGLVFGRSVETGNVEPKQEQRLKICRNSYGIGILNFGTENQRFILSLFEHIDTSEFPVTYGHGGVPQHPTPVLGEEKCLYATKPVPSYLFVGRR
jgi:hypothetical protein